MVSIVLALSEICSASLWWCLRVVDVACWRPTRVAFNGHALTQFFGLVRNVFPSDVFSGQCFVLFSIFEMSHFLDFFSDQRLIQPQIEPMTSDSRFTSHPVVLHTPLPTFTHNSSLHVVSVKRGVMSGCGTGVCAVKGDVTRFARVFVTNQCLHFVGCVSTLWIGGVILDPRILESGELES